MDQIISLNIIKNATTRILWRPLIDYPEIPNGYIEVSNTAQIRYTKDGTIINPIMCSKKPIVRIKIGMDTRNFSVARLFGAVYIPFPVKVNIKNWHIRFKDGDNTHITIDNMEWVTLGKKTYEEEERFLDFVYHHRHLTPKQATDLYFQETGIKIIPQNIQNLYMGNTQFVEDFGYEPRDFIPTYEAFRLTENVVEDICKILCIFNGNVRSAYKIVHQQYPGIAKATVHKILYKVAYAKISDKYFDYYGKGQFVNKLVK